jgi:hypothetical protein
MHKRRCHSNKKEKGTPPSCTAYGTHKKISSVGNVGDNRSIRPSDEALMTQHMAVMSRCSDGAVTMHLGNSSVTTYPGGKAVLVTDFIAFINTYKHQDLSVLKEAHIPSLEQFEDWRSEYLAGTIRPSQKKERIGNPVYLRHMAAIKIAKQYGLAHAFYQLFSSSQQEQLAAVHCSACKETITGNELSVENVLQHTHASQAQGSSPVFRWMLLCCHVCHTFIRDHQSMIWHWEKCSGSDPQQQPV